MPGMPLPDHFSCRPEVQAGHGQLQSSQRPCAVRFISARDNVPIKPPEHLPPETESVFAEGAACLPIGCYNAAATMFRLCADLTTRPLLPDEGDSAKPQPNGKQRRDLGLRLAWMFDNAGVAGTGEMRSSPNGRRLDGKIELVAGAFSSNAER
jgi:hypothetical protein